VPEAHTGETEAHPLLGRNVAFSLPDDLGALRSVPEPASKATVVDFWATFCKPCERSVPELAKRRTSLAAAGIELHFIGVLDRDESLSEAARVLASWGADTRFLVDRGGAVQRTLHVQLLPATLVLDNDGIARWLAGDKSNASEIERVAMLIAGAD
jgi:thiol-disulfide isomerase/thioredoxin